MSAVPSNILEYDPRLRALQAPFCDMSADSLLQYFHRRDHIHYFSVLDESQVTPDKLDGVLGNRFDFNQQSYQLADDFDWTHNPSTDIEWLILLHKFYYAVGLGRAFQETGDIRFRDKWVALTQRWIASVPIDFLSSDVTGRRIQNWIFTYRYFISHADYASLDADFHLDFLVSIRKQVDYLTRNLTPARNHRTLELYAIFIAAVVFPELQGAEGWLRFSIAELRKNLIADFLDDGVHCELSTDYHHIVLRNFIGIRRLAALNDIHLPSAIDNGIRKALQFCLYAHKPDGFIPAISDGDSADFRDLLHQGYQLYQDPGMVYVATAGQQGRAPAQRSLCFADSGYSILRSGWGEQEHYADERYLFFDCAGLGAGNHGHLDLLNIEIAAYGRSLIVDPGRYTYDESGDTNWRVLFRGTGYHNTVQVDGLNQTRYLPHIRKYKIQGPEPERRLKTRLNLPKLDYLHGYAASHEYPVVHERKILFVAGSYWLICDLLRAEELHDYDLRFHLDHLAEQRSRIQVDDRLLQVDAPNLLLLQPTDGDTNLSLQAGFVSPQYGSKYPAPVVKLSRRASNCCFYTVVMPYQSERPLLTVRWLPVAGVDGLAANWQAGGLEISCQGSAGTFQDQIYLSHCPGQRFRFADTPTDSAFFVRRHNALGQTGFCYDDAAN